MKSFHQEKSELTQFLKFIEEDIGNVRRVMQFCKSHDIDAEFIVHAKAETVEESASNTGIDPEDIVKTLVFVGEQPFAVLCPGDKKVDLEKLEDIRGREVDMAEFSEVEEATGYKVGGVSPFDLDIPVIMEETLLEKDEIKPAGGSRVVGAKVSPEELIEPLNAEVEEVVR